MIAKYMEQYIKELIELLEDDGEKKEDIDEACRYAENLLALNLPVIFDGVHLALLMGIDFDEYDKMLDSIESHYHTACIPKKSGKYRELDIPSIKLRAIQRWILKNILEKIKISEYATGFCINKSIVTNAKKHVNKNCVINIDLEDFFPSIKYDQVFNVFYYYGYTTLVSYYMANTCTFKGHLPQGAPTSPYISNIVCLKLDKRLSALAKSFGADYTRYADDITFSGNSDISAVIPIVERIIKEEGFRLNANKTRVAYKHQRQEVTGLLVNDNHIHISKKYIKKMKQEIYYCKKYGVDNHLLHENINKRFYKEHLYGKAYYVKMINEQLGIELLKELDQINWDGRYGNGEIE